MRDEQAAHAAADRAEQEAWDARTAATVAGFLARCLEDRQERAAMERANWGHDFCTHDKRCSKCGVAVRDFFATSLRDVCYGAFLETTRGRGTEMEPITPSQFYHLMAAIKAKWEADDDTEDAHIKADALLVKTLRSLGYEGGCLEFEGMDQWYS